MSQRQTRDIAAVDHACAPRALPRVASPRAGRAPGAVGLMAVLGAAVGLCGSGAWGAPAADQKNTGMRGAAAARTTAQLNQSAATSRITLEVAGPHGPALFEIAQPGAVVSEAARLDGDAADPKSLVRTPGFELTSRIVVRCVKVGGDEPLVRALAAQAGLKLEPADARQPLPANTYVLAAASVRGAIDAAAVLRGRAGVREAWVDMRLPIVDRVAPNDPLVGQQWHLINAVNTAFDLNVEGAWMGGYTGAGRTVCILEGGWDTTHPDLASKYFADASQSGPATGGNHGTATAGLAGAAGNNSEGGTGVAFDAMLSRCYYGSAITTASAFLYRNDLNDVKSNSWGPSDVGKVWTMSSVEYDAIQDGWALGRGGLGTVFVWAGGNGRAASDRTDYDPYASNRRVVCVGAVGDDDQVASYSEPGASLLAVTPSRRTFTDGPGIVSTWGGGTYTTTFNGTSAAAPIAAGAVALMLDANPLLTVRDVQHILVRSARKCDPADASWVLNGAGRWTSDDYGFGALDASAACTMAASWSNVRPLTTLVVPTQNVNLTIPDNAPASMGGGVSSSVVVGSRLRVEHAEVVLTAPHTMVGQLRVALTSPAGTVSLFAAPRGDTTSNQYQGYRFTSVRSWDEFANGTWTLTVSDESAGTTGTFTSWQLTLYGTAPACIADWDMNDQVGVGDLFSFLADWFAMRADVTGDGQTTVTDLFTFLEEWFGSSSGC